MKKAQVKTIIFSFLALILLIALVFAVTPVIISPADNFLSDDGLVTFRSTCTPLYDGTTSRNITNASFFSNFGGEWKLNATRQIANPIANVTFHFNFTLNVTEVIICWIV